MTAKEAIEQLKFDREMIQFDPMTGETYSEEQLKRGNKDTYRTWLADGVAIEALQKQVPKKVLFGIMKGHFMNGYHCPNCKELYVEKMNFEYCPFCGQRIDWEGEENDRN